MSPAQDLPATIVARFLKSNHYYDTLLAFIKEAGFPPDAGSTRQGDLTLEKIMEEKKVFDLSLQYQKTSLHETEKGWRIPAPSLPSELRLSNPSNLLYVAINSISNGSNQNDSQLIVATTAGRAYNMFSVNFDPYISHTNLHDSPILSHVLLDHHNHVTVTASMSGQVVVYSHKDESRLDERRDHKKYVVKVQAWPCESGYWVATAGWDGRVFLYLTEPHTYILGDPVASINCHSNPEAILFVKSADSTKPILLMTRRDSTCLYYYEVPHSQDAIANRQKLQDPSMSSVELRLLGKQNLAPHSNAWIAFSPASVEICPTDSDLLAVGTSATPHMKLIIVRILWSCMLQADERSENPASQAAQAKAELAVQEKEDAAICVFVNTMAPQTSYSTPQVAWRPDGSGVWVNGEDGNIRGLEAKTGRIISTLKDGHDSLSKIRSIWAGMVKVSENQEEEWLVSGGFDQKLLVWKPST